MIREANEVDWEEPSLISVRGVDARVRALRVMNACPMAKSAPGQLQGNRRKSFILAYAIAVVQAGLGKNDEAPGLQEEALSRAWPPPGTARRDARDARPRGVGLHSAAPACGVCQGAALLQASIGRRPPPKATSKADQHARLEGRGFHCTLRKLLKSHLAVTMLDYRNVTSQHLFNGY